MRKSHEKVTAAKPKKTMSKKTKVEAPKQKQTQKQIVNINIEKPKTRKKRIVKRQETIQKPITQYYQPSIDQSMRHKRGSMKIDLQQPTIIQQPLIEPEIKFKLDKLERRTQKIKEGVKQNQPISNIQAQTAKIKETPVQQSNIGTGIVEDIFSDAIETPTKPKRLDFGKPKSIFSRLLSPFRSSKPALTGPKEFPLLEYSSRSEETLPPSTAPSYIEKPTGKVINEDLQLLIRQLHAAQNSKIHRNTIRSAVSKKLKELGVGPQHTDKYEKDMREYYAKIFEERQFAGVRDEVTAAEPQKDVLKTKRKKDKKIPLPESLQFSTP